MGYVLFLMLLVAPPGQKDPKWTLQSTSSMEFLTLEACEAAAREVAASLENVSSINLAAWCFNQEKPREKGAQPQTEKKFGPSAKRSSPRDLGTASQVELRPRSR